MTLQHCWHDDSQGRRDCHYAIVLEAVMWLIFHDDKGPVGKEPVLGERKAQQEMWRPETLFYFA